MFTQKITMNCTQEQYEKYLKEELDKMGYEEFCVLWGDIASSHVITNCFCNRPGFIGSISHRGIKACDRTYLSSFNAELFLALAAMTDKDTSEYGEWLIGNRGEYVRNNDGESWINFTYWRKATVEEIMEKFGKQEPVYLKDEFQKLQEKVTLALEKIERIEGALEKNNDILKVQKEEKFDFKKGAYVTIINDEGRKRTGILSDQFTRGNDSFPFFVSITYLNQLIIGQDFGFHIGDSIRPSTPSEIALLDSKLAEYGIRFDKDTCEIVDIPQHKEPVIGEMAIFWDSNKAQSICRLYIKVRNDKYVDFCDTSWENAILYESPEQYKNFLKEQ